MAPVTPWQTILHPTQDSEDVKGLVDNRMPLEVAQRTQNLKERLDAIEAGQALFITSAALATDTLVGHAVYWDAATAEYKKALAAVEVDVNGQFTIKNSTYVVGLVVSKSSATRGTVMLLGYLAPPFDFTNTIGTAGATAAEAGAYYLSASIAGHLTKQKPPVGIYAAYLRGDGSAHFSPAPREVVEDHIHYVFDLFAVPAGTLDKTEPNETYKFVTVDPNLPGWLPADDPIFCGLAPAGAKFGYNLALHPELQRIFPPIPTDSAYLEADGIAVPQNRYSITPSGLFWLNDCYGKAPWPINAAPGSSSLSSSSSSSSSSSPSGTCDSGAALEQIGYVRRNPDLKTLRLWFTKLVNKTATSVVTSLQPAPGSPIRVLGCDGVTAKSKGDLQLALDMDFSTDENQLGYQAIKGFVGEKFQRGPIVEGLIAGTNVEIVPEPTMGEELGGVNFGRLLLNVIDPNSGVRDSTISIIALDEVLQGTTDDVFFLYFPEDKDSSFRGRIEVPSVGPPTPAYMELYFWLLARITGTMPLLTISYRRILKPAASCSKVLMPTSDTALADITPASCGSVTAGYYLEVTAAKFLVTAGDIVLFTLGRLGATDGYSGDLAVLRQGYKISGTP